MIDASPRKVLEQVVAAVPHECRENIIIVGSLAAGYQLLPPNDSFQVRTKDIDCVLFPRIRAVSSGRAISERLLSTGWRPREEGEYGRPGTATTPDDQLPAVRLYPPNSTDWFIELLAVPESESERGKRWTRLELSTGHFGLPSFQFMSLSTFHPIKIDLGVFCARVELMALANLLEHPKIAPETMSGLVPNRLYKRSNKDLGRVLAIAGLSIGNDGDALLAWPASWEEALRARFPSDWRSLALRAGAGLRELLASASDLDEATVTCNEGLLTSRPRTAEQLLIVGKRMIQDAIEPIEKRATS